MELDKLAPAIVALQAELTPVDKSAANPFFKSKYAPLPEVRAAMQPLLAKHGLALVIMPTIIDGHNGLHFYLVHESGQRLEGQWLLTPTPDKNGVITPQGEGSDATYKRRYGEMAIMGLVADEDDDGNAAAKPARPTRQTEKAETQPALETAKTQLRAAIKKAKAKPEEFAWVADATAADVDKILGVAAALNSGTVTETV